MALTNQKTAELLLTSEKTEDQKVQLLRKAAVEFKNSEKFLQSCANTQRAAARWDTIYTFLLRSDWLFIRFLAISLFFAFIPHHYPCHN